MSHFLRGAAFTAALTVAVPVWAQVPLTSEQLNSQELNRLAQAQQAAPVAPPNGFIGDAVGLNAAVAATSPAPRFPGALPLLGLAARAAGSVANRVLFGIPND
jgi:hypothetical protein